MIHIIFIGDNPEKYSFEHEQYDENTKIIEGSFHKVLFF